MIVTAYILAIVFGIIDGFMLAKFIFGSLNTLECLIGFISIIIIAISAGLIHSGSWSAFVGG